MNSTMHAISSCSSGGRQQFGTNYSASSSHNGRPRQFCVFCKKLGHTKDKCYKLHGYPQSNTNGQISDGYGYQNNRHNNAQNQKFNPNHRSAKGKGIAANAWVLMISLLQKAMLDPHNTQILVSPRNNMNNLSIYCSSFK